VFYIECPLLAVPVLKNQVLDSARYGILAVNNSVVPVLLENLALASHVIKPCLFANFSAIPSPFIIEPPTDSKERLTSW
jgi:hypothetical protein